MKGAPGEAGWGFAPVFWIFLLRLSPPLFVLGTIPLNLSYHSPSPGPIP